MNERKRTTVTTIETHEVWVITPAAERPEEVTVARLEADQTEGVDPPAEAPAVPETGSNEVITPRN